MIYYQFSALMLTGIKEVPIVANRYADILDDVSAKVYMRYYNILRLIT